MNPAAGDFSLQSNSPCIDTGNPNAPLDPDNTNSDMGAYYFNQATYSVSVGLSPYGMPITIPANGGSFDFDIDITNGETVPTNVTIWTMVTLPNGSEYGPVIGPITVTLAASSNVSRLRSQAVPSSAPSGNYTYDAYVGNYPGNIWGEDHFDFSKSMSADNGGIENDWYSFGESFEESGAANSVLTPEDYSILSAYPNPFNPETHLSFVLGESGHASLSIYDITGKHVATLFDGFAGAGVQELTWNAQDMSSGVYFAVLQTEVSSSTQKLLLIK